MRVHVKTPGDGLSSDKISLSCLIRYFAKSVSGFPGGRTYYYYSNSTMDNSRVNHIARPDAPGRGK